MKINNVACANVSFASKKNNAVNINENKQHLHASASSLEAMSFLGKAQVAMSSNKGSDSDLSIYGSSYLDTDFIQSQVENAIESCKIFNHYDDNLQVQGIEQLTEDLAKVNKMTVRATEDGDTVVSGVLPDGSARQIYIKTVNGKNYITCVLDTSDTGHLWTRYDKNSRLCEINVNKKNVYPHKMTFTSQNGEITHFSIHDQDNLLLCNSFCDRGRTIKF